MNFFGQFYVPSGPSLKSLFALDFNKKTIGKNKHKNEKRINLAKRRKTNLVFKCEHHRKWTTGNLASRKLLLKKTYPNSQIRVSFILGISV